VLALICGFDRESIERMDQFVNKTTMIIKVIKDITGNTPANPSVFKCIGLGWWIFRNISRHVLNIPRK